MKISKKYSSESVKTLYASQNWRSDVLFTKKFGNFERFQSLKPKWPKKLMLRPKSDYKNLE